MPLTFFKCAKCRRTFDSYKEAKACEDGHLKPVSVKAVQYTVELFPYSVEVTFNNGETRIYNARDLGG